MIIDGEYGKTYAINMRPALRCLYLECRPTDETAHSGDDCKLGTKTNAASRDLLSAAEHIDCVQNG
jgi:hypothetical protein